MGTVHVHDVQPICLQLRQARRRLLRATRAPRLAARVAAASSRRRRLLASPPRERVRRLLEPVSQRKGIACCQTRAGAWADSGADGGRAFGPQSGKLLYVINDAHVGGATRRDQDSRHDGLTRTSDTTRHPSHLIRVTYLSHISESHI